MRFASGTFRPGASAATAAPTWYRDMAEDLSARGRQYVVAIASGPLDVEQRRRIEQAGGSIVGYVPEHGYRLRIDPAAVEAVRALPFIVWAGATPPHYKVQPELTRRAAKAKSPIEIRVILEGDEPPERAHRALTGLNPSAAPSGKDGAWRLRAVVPPGRIGAVLSRLAGLPEVEAIEIARPFRLMNQDGVWIHQSHVGPPAEETPIFDRGIFGCGQIIGVADSGQDYDSCFFRDTVNGPPPISLCPGAPCPAATPDLSRRKDILYYNWSNTTPTGDDDTCPTSLFGASGHGTHTSGSAAGDDSPYADCASFTSPERNAGDGQAPGARLIIQEMGDGLEYLNSGNGTIWNLADVAFQNGARIHTNSWGNACFDPVFGLCDPDCTMEYDSFARDVDLAMWTYPDFLLLSSAGNAAGLCPPPQAVGSPGNAKSLISVGSVGHGVNSDSVSAFSSPGPVHDGRMGPTVAAQGEAVVSAGSDLDPGTNNCNTCPLDGTSMASPTVAGLAALVREYYMEGFYASGVRDPGSGLTPTAALLKATLIDGAVDPGPAGASPDFDSGFGRVLLDRTLAFTGSPFTLRAHDHRDGVTTGSVVTYGYDVTGSEPFRATLVWTDYPAAINAAVARVNELMLEVIDPSGNVWFQTLDGTTGLPVQTSSMAAAHDSLNVEERLVFDSPAAGRWVVRVRGIDVPMGPQPFALLVRGDLTDCPSPIAPSAPSLGTPADHEVEVTWSAVSGAAAYNVYRSLGSCPGGPRVQIAAGVTGTSFTDTTVSGGVTYSYYVSAGSDVGALCESSPSTCAEVVPAGDCFLLPETGGALAATSADEAACGINLAWNPATPLCAGGDVRYNIYRDTSAGFTPGPANRIARCIGGTSYSDSAGLAYGTTYHYVVRAEDATSGHGGPCRGGNEESNLAKVSVGPSGPPIVGSLIDDAGDTGAAAFTPGGPWVAAATGGTTGGAKVYRGDSEFAICGDLVSPILPLGPPANSPQLSFATIHTLQFEPIGILGFSEGSVGQVEIATGPGFSDWTRLQLNPDYPQPVELTGTTCDTITDLTTYFSNTDTTYSTYTADLSSYGGSDVRIRFRLSGDFFYPNGSWWIDDIVVTQTQVPSSCTTQAIGPPPIPDGASVPGMPLTVSLSGGDLVLEWDTAECPPAAVNVYYGNIGDYTTFTGGFCGLAPSGMTTVSMPDDVWFVVAGTDGASTDGSWSRDPLGGELSYSGASAVCPAITQHVTNNSCP